MGHYSLIAVDMEPEAPVRVYDRDPAQADRLVTAFGEVISALGAGAVTIHGWTEMDRDGAEAVTADGVDPEA